MPYHLATPQKNINKNDSLCNAFVLILIFFGKVVNVIRFSPQQKLMKNALYPLAAVIAFFSTSSFSAESFISDCKLEMNCGTELRI